MDLNRRFFHTRYAMCHEHKSEENASSGKPGFIK